MARHMDEQDIVGKTVEYAEISGFGVLIRFTDGTTLDFNASDGGYSTFEIYKGEGE